jgi:hypothetical protein
MTELLRATADTLATKEAAARLDGELAAPPHNRLKPRFQMGAKLSLYHPGGGLVATAAALTNYWALLANLPRPEPRVKVWIGTRLAKSPMKIEFGPTGSCPRCAGRRLPRVCPRSDLKVELGKWSSSSL